MQLEGKRPFGLWLLLLLLLASEVMLNPEPAVRAVYQPVPEVYLRSLQPIFTPTDGHCLRLETWARPVQQKKNRAPIANRRRDIAFPITPPPSQAGLLNSLP